MISGLCGFPSTAGSDRNLHARENPHPQDFPDPDLQGSLVAENPRECRHGPVSGTLSPLTLSPTKSDLYLPDRGYDKYPLFIVFSAKYIDQFNVIFM